MCYHAPGDPRTEIADNGVFDFDMVAIGHEGFTTAGRTLQIMKGCLDREPRRPALCGEASYERHMQTNFDDVQRHMFWSFLLSGAAGHTYGAAGIPGEVRFVYRPKRRIYDWSGPIVKGLEPNVPYSAL